MLQILLSSLQISGSTYNDCEYSRRDTPSPKLATQSCMTACYATISPGMLTGKSVHFGKDVPLLETHQ